MLRTSAPLIGALGLNRSRIVLSDLTIWIVVQMIFCAILATIYRKNLRAGSLALLLIVSACSPLALGLGMFLGSFDANICYSDTIQEIIAAAESAMNSDDTKAKVRFIEFAELLPLEGYETNCEELLRRLHDNSQ